MDLAHGRSRRFHPNKNKVAQPAQGQEIDQHVAFIDHAVSKADRMLGSLLKRICKGLDNPRTLHSLYCSLVR